MNNGFSSTASILLMAFKQSVEDTGKWERCCYQSWASESWGLCRFCWSSLWMTSMGFSLRVKLETLLEPQTIHSPASLKQSFSGSECVCLLHYFFLSLKKRVSWDDMLWFARKQMGQVSQSRNTEERKQKTWKCPSPVQQVSASQHLVRKHIQMWPSSLTNLLGTNIQGWGKAIADIYKFSSGKLALYFVKVCFWDHWTARTVKWGCWLSHPDNSHCGL